MASDASTCPSCGARVPADNDRCDLCGTPVDADPSTPVDDPTEGTLPDSSDASSASDAPSASDAAESSGPGSSSRATPDGVFCNQCGHKNPAAANFCSKCGSELEDLAALDDEGGAEPDRDPVPKGTKRVAADLPPGETPSPDASTASEDTDEDDTEQQLMGQQLTFVVGGAILLVAALFFVTLWSQSQSWGSEDTTPPPQSQASNGGGPEPGISQSGAPSQRGETPAGARSAPSSPGASQGSVDLASLVEQTSGTMPSQLQSQADSMQSVLDDAAGEEVQATQRRLVNLYVGAGQPARAALVQKDLAEATGATEQWKRTGDLFYTWMQQLQQQQNRQAAFQVAQQAADAYQTVVDANPDDLEARTRMGEAYLLTNNPMRGIEAINGVLADDSTFVPAIFQKGLALLQINRLDGAVQEFEKVKSYTSEGDPYFRQSERAIQIIREQDGSGSGGS